MIVGSGSGVINRLCEKIVGDGIWIYGNVCGTGGDDSGIGGYWKDVNGVGGNGDDGGIGIYVNGGGIDQKWRQRLWYHLSQYWWQPEKAMASGSLMTVMDSTGGGEPRPGDNLISSID